MKIAGQPNLSLQEIRKAVLRIESYICQTPIYQWQSKWVEKHLGDGELHLKMEFLQKTGSFKARGAFNNVLTKNNRTSIRGLTAVSAGNHAIAVAYTAYKLNLSAKIIMHKAANPFRIKKCQQYGAEIVLMDDISAAFDRLDEISEIENRLIVHPFDGIETLQGTATIGLEIAESLGEIDAILVGVGGGGLIAGVATALKHLQPNIKVIGVEPIGACGLTRSLEIGYPLQKVQINTIADSMGAPLHCETSFKVCQQLIDQMIVISDDELCRAMALVYDSLKFALEPSGVAVIAALESNQYKLKHQRVAGILCGSNIDQTSWAQLALRGRK